MAHGPTIELERLREIGWQEWDPIGLRGSDCPPDEYDSYLLQVVSQLRRGASVKEAAEYLDRIGAEDMGLGSSTKASSAAAVQAVTSIKDYLDAIPKGPIRVR